MKVLVGRGVVESGLYVRGTSNPGSAHEVHGHGGWDSRRRLAWI